MQTCPDVHDSSGSFPSFSSSRALARIWFVHFKQHYIHLPASLCSTLVTRFPAPMKALTPARLSRTRRGIPDFATRTSDRSAPKHLMSPVIAFPRPSASRTSLRTVSRLRPPGLGFAIGLQARQHIRPNRVPLVRTGHLPSVALHPAFERRSYGWLWSMSV